MITRLILHPRLTRRGYHYDVEHLGELIVVGSTDPEHAAARALLAIGVTGVAETIDAATMRVRLLFDIETFARTKTVQRKAGGISIEPWRPMPSSSSHGGARKRFSEAGDEEVANQKVDAPVLDRGRST